MPLVSALATLYVVWGSTYLAIRVLVEEVPPLLAAGARFLAAAALLGGFLLVRGGLGAFRLAPREALGAAAVSVLTLFGAFSLLFLAETRVPSGLAALLIASIPLWVVLLRLGARESVARVTLVAVVVGFGGVGLLLAPGGEGGTGAPVAWLLLVVGAAVSEAVGSFTAQRVRLPQDALVSATVQMAFAGGLTGLVAFAAGEWAQLDIGAISGEAAAAFAFLVLPGSVLAYTAFVWLLANASVSTATTYAYVNPVVAILLGWAILSEKVTAVMLAGAAAIVLAVAVVVRTENSRS